MQDCESNFIFVDFHICSADLFLAPPPTLEDQVDSKNKKGKTGGNWKSRSGVAGGEKKVLLLTTEGEKTTFQWPIVIC